MSGSRITRGIAWTVPVALLLWGLWSFPLALFGPERDRLPGDLGDARFNNYLLEHFHRYVTGKEKSYWDAPFMYPEKNVIARSDNLLGTAPIYSFFRSIGYNRETAFQWWILALFALNYLGCFIALRMWSGSTVLAACGAYVFAFGIHFIGQLEHAQVFARFMVPMAAYCFGRWLDLRTMRWAALAAASVIVQLYCGVYLGFMLIYLLGCLGVAHLVIHRRSWFPLSIPRRSAIAAHAVVLAVSLLLLLPLAIPYLRMAAEVGPRTMDQVQATIPRPVSYFFTHPAAISWRDLSLHGQFAFPEWWSHFHFMGALPWLAIIALPIVLLSRGVDAGRKRMIAWLALALLLAILFCLNIGERSLYALVQVLPGFSAMRAIDRIINVQALLFAALLVLVARCVPWKGVPAAFGAIALAVLVVVDNRVDVHELKRIDKYASREAVRDVERQIIGQYDSTATAIAYMPVLFTDDSASLHERTIDLQVTVMLAAQYAGLPVVNGYSGSYPDGYMDFFDRMDGPSLAAWCAVSGCDTARIQPISNMGEPVLSTGVVRIISFGDRAWGIEAGPDEPVTAMPSTDGMRMLRLDLHGGRVAFAAPNDRYLAREPLENDRVCARARSVGDMGVFHLTMLDATSFSLKADNGRYVSQDTLTGQLFARSVEVGPLEQFVIKDAR